MKAPRPGARRVLWGIAISALPACSMQMLQPVDIVERSPSDDDAATGAPPPVTSDEATLALVADAGYASSPAFTHVSRGPYPSAAAPGSFVDVWVSSSAYGAYAAISPEGGAVDAALPLGAVIVRAVSGASGALTKLTVMRRGPSGLDPADGDWWFAETDPTGALLADDAGPLAGPLAACTPCHLGRAAEGYLFGVPMSAR